MNTLSRSCLVLLALFLGAPAWADTDLAATGRRIELSGYRADADGLVAVRTLLQTELKNAGQPDKYLYYYLGYADYVLARLYARSGDESKATDLVEAGQEALLHAVELDAHFAEAEVLLGSCYGFEIGLHPFKGIWLGSKAGRHMQQGLQLAPDDPRVILLKAIADFSTPSSFGGDKARAQRGFRAAIAAYGSYVPADATAPTWGRAETYAWLALSEAQSGDTEAARKDYGKALELEPDYALAAKRLAALPPAAGTAVGPATTH